MRAASSAARALVFDFNGTLSHDEPILCAIYQELFAERGRPLTAVDYYAQLAGLAEEEIIGRWLGVQGPELETLVAERVARYRARAGDGSSVPERVREVVRYAAARVPVALVSGAFRAEIEPVLEGCGLAPLFRAVVAADDVANGKPHPEGYERVVELLGEDVRPLEVVALEDTEAGVAAAKAAGLRCVAVAGTVARERLAAADELVEQIDVELVRRLLA